MLSKNKINLYLIEIWENIFMRPVKIMLEKIKVIFFVFKFDVH